MVEVMVVFVVVAVIYKFEVHVALVVVVFEEILCAVIGLVTRALGMYAS